MGPGTADGALPGRGSSLAQAEVIAGSQASTERAGLRREPAEAGFLSSALLPEGLNQPAGAAQPIP